MNKTAGKFRDFTPGVTVKLSGDHLVRTGQRIGGEGAKRWLVVACTCGLCKNGRHIAVNEPTMTSFTPDEIAAEPGIVNRHIAKDNLTIVGQVDSRNAGDTYVGKVYARSRGNR